MDVLDRLPLPVLLALQEAAALPNEVGMERARKRAEDAGFYLVVMGGALPGGPGEALPMEEAPDGVEAIRLDLSERLPEELSS
jgi:hypothetical protein